MNRSSAPTVYISRDAFFNMVIAAIEAFKLECLGFVFGKTPNKTNDKFIIDNTAATQITKTRLYTEVEAGDLSDKRLAEMFSWLPTKFRPLGTFHSHAEWGSKKPLRKMSETDTKAFIDNDGKLEIIIVMTSRERGRALWRIHNDGSARGSISKYNIEIHVYALISKNDKRKPLHLKIVAPEALSFFNNATKPH